MKRLSFVPFILFFLIINLNIPAQNKFRIEVNGGKIINGIQTQNELSYWPDGWTAGVGLKYALSPEIEIGFNTSYSNLTFDKNKVCFAYTTDCCYRFEVTGNNAKVYEAAFSLQLNSMPKFFIPPYFTFRTGVYFLNKGEVHINIIALNKTTNINENLGVFGNTGINVTKVFAGAGLGVIVYFTDNIGLRTQILLTASLNGGQSFFPITAGLNLGL